MEFANQLVGKAFASGLFMFADTDLKFDQPQAEVVFDRDKVRSQGVDLSQAGRDLSTLLGGNYVNRFSIQGRSYKVIPQVKRAERLTPDQLSEIHVTGPGGKLVPLSTFATLKTTTEPRELKRFQQLNAVRIQGVIPPHVSLDQALGYLETEARAILPQGFTHRLRGRVAAAPHRGQQLPRDVPALGDPDLPRARRAVRELPRSVHHPRGLGAARDLGRAGLLVPRAHDAQHLQPGGPDHAGRPGVEERHPDRRVREPPAGDRAQTSCDAVIEAAGTRLRPILMTTAATVVGHLPLVFASGPGAGARNSIGIMLVSGMIIGTLFTLFVVPSIYMLVARRHTATAAEPADQPAAIAEPAGAAV